jgi:hypothetical protein
MHEKALPRASRELLARIGTDPPESLAGWTLAGGTGLALHLGHRRSDDFDFFRAAGMETRSLYQALATITACETLQSGERTLTVLAGSVKMSFFQIPDPFLFDSVPYAFFRVADPRDIALMKLLAVTNRGSRRDFVDLYTILRGGPPLRDYLDWLPRKFGKGSLSDYQVLLSLTYFDDAEIEPMPKMLEPFDWEECKAFFEREARALVLPHDP